jgi:hypothetical protein|tara:strand:- start:7827 stop:8129 length:303 start_codon:yes stop_codon:yes gene_type:complete
MTRRFDEKVNALTPKTEILTESAWTKILDAVQTGLDFIGLEPTFGTFADGGNTLVSLLRAAAAKEPDERNKHLILAAIRAISMVPAGDVAKLARLTIKGL